MKKEKIGIIALCALFTVLALSGCSSTAKGMTASANGKNLDLSGCVMLGELETANPETATPQGRMILGRVTYKSRKVGIPVDQKVPNTANFRATKSTGLLGTTEIIYEYDWTAGSDAEAKATEEMCQKLQQKTAAELEPETLAGKDKKETDEPGNQ